MRIGARDADLAGFERLAQAVEDAALEFGQFVEEQHAKMREADLAWTDAQPAADERGHRRRMVRRAERARAHEPPALEAARHRRDHRHFERFGGGQLGQYARHARRHQRLARSGRAAEQKIMRARCRDLERALRRLLPLDLGKVRGAHRGLDLAGHRRRQDRLPLEMREQRQEVGRPEHLDASGPRCFGSLRRRADQSALDAARVNRGEQHAGRRRHPPVEPELADDDIARQRLGIDHPHRAQQCERDRQVVVRAFLRQVGGRQVHRDHLRRQRQADRGDRRAHALAALADRLVGQADDDEARHAGRDLALHLDPARIDAEIGDG